MFWLGMVVGVLAVIAGIVVLYRLGEHQRRDHMYEWRCATHRFMVSAYLKDECKVMVTDHLVHQHGLTQVEGP